jgi:DDE superfamily endonuclease
MAAHQKKALAQQAHVIFADESGLLMAPLVRRTWAPRGQRPVLRQRGRHREKVSVAAALWWAPWRRRQLGLIFQTLVDAYFNNHRSAVFLELILREIPNRIVVIWDGGNMHKGDPIREAVERFRPRLTLERLPPYAPMLNPVEPLWSWLKYSRLCNAAPANAPELNRTVLSELAQVSNDQEFLRGMWHGSELPLPRALLL